MLTDPCTPLIVPCLKMSKSYLRINNIILSQKTEKKNGKTLIFFVKYAPYQTVSVGLLFISVQSKHRNSLFRYRTETTESNCYETDQNKPKQTKTTLHFLKKIQIYALYHTVSVALLFVSVQSKHQNSLFRYRTKTNQFRFSFGCFQSKLVSKDTLYKTHRA